MSIKGGNVVGVIIGGAPAVAGLVLAARANGNKEPLIDVVVTRDNGGPRLDTLSIHDVPCAEDSEGHYLWTYSGPEVMVRRAAEGNGAEKTVAGEGTGSA